MDKLRELSLAGDKEAERHVQEIELTRRENDVTRALKFERDLLSIAKKFELISPLEFIDLERLQADRNRCAHPSLTADEQAYSPAAELARVHIHSAVIHLLQHPPAQGKYALDRLLRDVESEYFPMDAKQAQVAFAAGPLKRPRDSLVRNFVLVLVKALLNDNPDYKRRLRLETAILATSQLHPQLFSTTLRERLSVLVRAIPDERLSAVTYFIRDVRDCWQYLEADVVQRIKSYVQMLPAKDFEDLEFLLQWPETRAQAQHRVNLATRNEIHNAMFFGMPKEIVDRFINIYLSSASFDEANACAKQLILVTSDFDHDHIRKLLVGAGRKSQVLGSYELGPLIANLRGKKRLPADEFEKLLNENNLEEFALP